MKPTHLALIGAVAVAAGAASRRAPKPVADAADKLHAAVASAVPTVAAGEPARSQNLWVRLYQDAMQDRLLAVAAGVAFYALLSLVPTMAAGVSLFGLVSDPVRLAKLPEALGGLLPHDAVTLVQGEAQRLAGQGAQTLSIKLGIALALSLYSASAAARAMFDALNVIDEQEETRGVVRLYATSLGATLGGIVVFLIALLLIGANPKFVALGPLSDQTVGLYGLLRWPVFFAFATGIIMSLYYIGPARPPARFRRLLPGAALAALLWAGGSWLFGWYVATLGNYSASYGSLATVVVMMTWMWLSTAIILFGAQLNYELTRM